MATAPASARATPCSRCSDFAACTSCSGSCSCTSSVVSSRTGRSKRPMVELWFVVLGFMLVAYVVLDGFDFGAGTLHLFVAKSDPERRTVLAAIGPFWDGNEVWLIAVRGVLFVAFPELLTTAFPAFYLALHLVLWCFVLRGIAIEVRSHVADGMWKAFWDAVFALASTLLALLFGVAFGNVVRGVPVDESREFTMPLFTNFGTTGHVGLLDYYSLSVG